MTVTWWCSGAQGGPWTWTWRPYPGVWLLVGAIALTYAWAIARLQPRRMAGDDRPTHAKEIALFATGLIILWIGADWPIGALGASYLLSVKTLQYLLFVFVAPPLMLMGMPRWLLRRLVRGRLTFRLARFFMRPLLPFLLTNAVLVFVHLPRVVDNLSKNPLAAFGLDMAVIASGFIFWWPALGRLPELNPMQYPLRILYLLLQLFIPTVPASFFTFGRYPIYGLYELAPRVWGLSAVQDQQIAGLLMKIGGGFILFGVTSVMFFRWYRGQVAAEELEATETV